MAEKTNARESFTSGRRQDALKEEGHTGLPIRTGSYDKDISRREFARQAALAAATVAALPGNLLAPSETIAASVGQRGAEMVEVSQVAVAPPTTQQPVEEPKLSPESRAEIEAKIQNILRKHGQRLSDEQKADVRRLVMEGQKPLEALRAFALDNSDEPATVLKLYPARESRPRSRPAPRRTPAPKPLAR